MPILERDGERFFVIAERIHRYGCHTCADALRDGQRLLRAGIWQQDNEFIPTVARNQIGGAHLRNAAICATSASSLSPAVCPSVSLICLK